MQPDLLRRALAEAVGTALLGLRVADISTTSPTPSVPTSIVGLAAGFWLIRAISGGAEAARVSVRQVTIGTNGPWAVKANKPR